MSSTTHGLIIRQERPTTWMPEPTFRGTFGILSLCINTLLISVWSAVHKDIPVHRHSKLRSLISSVLWMAAALFCPELLLFIAFNQRTNAGAVLDKANANLGTPELPNKDSWVTRIWRSASEPGQTEEKPAARQKADQPIRRHPFTFVHAFYASMGGYVFDFSDEQDPEARPGFFSNNRSRMAITSVGIQFLLEHDPDLIPDISEDSITDRTQASSLSKALLIFQVAWFCANCMSRLAKHLPLSLLEVATVAHGFCTLVTYLLWWHKPLNVAAPTLIRGPKAREACAFMMMCSTEEFHMIYGVACIRLPAEMQSIHCFGRGASGQTKGPSAAIPEQIYPQNVNTHLSKTPETCHVLPLFIMPEKQSLGDTGFSPTFNGLPLPAFYTIKCRALYGSQVPWYSKHRNPGDRVLLLAEDIRRWTLCSTAMDRYGLSQPPIPPKPYVTVSSSLQSSTDFKEYGIRGIIRSNLSAAALTAIFGVPHFLGWNADFPTNVERRLWRISTLVVSCWGLAMCCAVAAIIAVRLSLGIYTGERRGETRLVATAAVPYIVMTGFLLLESLRQLFFLDPEAYQIPSWSNYFPHFS